MAVQGRSLRCSFGELAGVCQEEEEGPDIEERGTTGRPNTSGWQLRCANREGAGPWAVLGATLEISRTKRPQLQGSRMVSSWLPCSPISRSNWDDGRKVQMHSCRGVQKNRCNRANRGTYSYFFLCFLTSSCQSSTVLSPSPTFERANEVSILPGGHYYYCTCSRSKYYSVV